MHGGHVIDPARFIRESVRAEPFDFAQDRPGEAQPFDKTVLSLSKGHAAGFDKLSPNGFSNAL